LNEVEGTASTSGKANNKINPYLIRKLPTAAQAVLALLAARIDPCRCCLFAYLT